MRTVNCAQLAGTLRRNSRGALRLEIPRAGKEGSDLFPLQASSERIRVELESVPSGTWCYVEGPLATESGRAGETPPPVLVSLVVTTGPAEDGA
jgi:hypothetical protein